jgi:hypothetical protein
MTHSKTINLLASTAVIAVAAVPVAACGGGGGATASLPGTATRADGTQQVTHHGHPLYLFADDQNPGDVEGHGVTAFGAAWFVLSAAGSQISTKPASTSGGGTSGGSSGY